MCPVDYILVHLGPEKSWVGVFLHEAVDFTLSLVEAVWFGICQALLGPFPGAVVKVYLSWCLDINELLEDLVGFRHKLGGALDFFVLFTGHPKLDILVTELCLEKCAERRQPIFVRDELIK